LVNRAYERVTRWPAQLNITDYSSQALLREAVLVTSAKADLPVAA
jgi:hypothetical protein